MKPAPFEYCRPDSLTEALSLLGEYGDEAEILAGGLSLGPLLNTRMARPTVVIDINRLGELGAIERSATHLRLGALVRQAEVQDSAECKELLPLLVAALGYVGHYQTRSRGTLAGSVAMADPSSEIPLALATLAGEVELTSGRGVRRLAADEFFQGALSTARADDEMITALLWPLDPPRTHTAFEEISERPGDFAIVSVAAWAQQKPGERLLNYGLGLGGVEDRPHCLQGEVETQDDLAELAAEIAQAAARDVSPVSDQRAGADYRRHLVGHLGYQAVHSALQQATESTA
ncbi:MAG TPA: FAD binding domain-containing protein [Alphaproteobacteria bacterium]|jgi:CO/xanthine dehydrogenase FAD-binding subunit|nr:FAD binding domain-containing protein [Rhodospirillales bacterium]HJP22247.1 FAD binding domain-containing protein [Alphaproteobacteria bacterium]